MPKNFLEGNEIEKEHHRILSASATFQKGIYHLFVLRNTAFSDAFDSTLRVYQCIFLICVTQILLDFEGEKFEKLRGKEDKERANRDPGAAITHGGIKSWKGFTSTHHPLHKISQETKVLYKNVCDARHNLVYRPYFEIRDKEGPFQPFWEDCTLEQLLKGIPKVNDIEQAYKDFYKSVSDWVTQGYGYIFKTGLSVPLTTPP